MTLLEHLRSATADVHARLEAGLDIPGWSQNPASYASLLARLRSVYGPFETAVSASPHTAGAVPDWSSRRKVHWLDEDLAALGVSARPDVPSPDLPSPEAVLGSVYVMEGATLGGGVIERLVRDWPASCPHRFFTGYGPSRAARWRAFRSHARALEAGGGDTAAVVSAAVSTFAAVERAVAAKPAVAGG